MLGDVSDSLAFCFAAYMQTGSGSHSLIQKRSKGDAACSKRFSFASCSYLFLWFGLLLAVGFGWLLVLSSKELSHVLICNALLMLLCSIEQAVLQSYCVHSQKDWLKILASGLCCSPARQKAGSKAAKETDQSCN